MCVWGICLISCQQTIQNFHIWGQPGLCHGPIFSCLSKTPQRGFTDLRWFTLISLFLHTEELNVDSVYIVCLWENSSVFLLRVSYGTCSLASPPRGDGGHRELCPVYWLDLIPLWHFVITQVCLRTVCLTAETPGNRWILSVIHHMTTNKTTTLNRQNQQDIMLSLVSRWRKWVVIVFQA